MENKMSKRHGKGGWMNFGPKCSLTKEDKYGYSESRSQ